MFFGDLALAQASTQFGDLDVDPDRWTNGFKVLCRTPSGNAGLALAAAIGPEEDGPIAVWGSFL